MKLIIIKNNEEEKINNGLYCLCNVDIQSKEWKDRIN